MKILNRKHLGTLKWNEDYIKERFQVNDISTIYPLYIADMDFEMAPEITQALQKYVENPDFGYYVMPQNFYTSIVDWYQEIHHLNIDKDWIIPSIGTITTLHLLCDCFGKNQTMVYMPPVYGPFKTCVDIGQGIAVPLIKENKRYTIDFELLEKVFKENKVSILLMCHPHNPGGIAFDLAILKRLVLLCKQYDVLLLVDEIHGDLELFDTHFTSMIAFGDIYSKIIISTSPNKTFNLPALTTSYILCQDKQLRDTFTNYFNHLHLACNRVGLEMVTYAYTYGKSWFNQLKAYIQDNMNLAIAMFEGAGIEVMQPDCGYLLWIRLEGIDDLDAFVLSLAKETHVLVESGSRFISHYNHCVRINVATDRELLKEAISLLISYYKRTA